MTKLLCGSLLCILAIIANPIIADDGFSTLIDEIWDYELLASPMLATNIGDPRGQDRLRDDSLAAIQLRFDDRQAFLNRLRTIDPANLDELRQVDYSIAERRLENQVADFQFQMHCMPISNRDGFHIEFPELARVMNPRTEEDFANYIARLNDFSRYADEQIALLRSGIKAGLTQPAVILRESVKQATAHVIDDPTKSLWLTNVSQASRDSIGEVRWNAISQQIIEAIQSSVIPSYRRFADFLETEYIPACRTSVGASALERGRAFYSNRVKQFTTLDITPEELHSVGMRENERIRTEMNAIVKQVAFDGDLEAFLVHLRTSPEFYATTKEQLLKEVAYILKTADGKLPDLFGKLPRTPYGIREVPEYVAPQTTSAYYWPPATDGTRAGFYYVNTYNLAARPLYQLEALSLHEAVPGHHLQLALQAELTDLHPLTRESGVTAFIEGWALYSEWLGKELGFYQDPYQDFGRLSMEAWRASRLVVDTGIHWMGWSRQQAIEYLQNNTALSEHNVIAEIDRYIGWPGQALAYKVGELEIRKLRGEAEVALGSRFDRREFHDQVLKVGAIPLPLLRDRIERWSENQSRIDNLP